MTTILSALLLSAPAQEAPGVVYEGAPKNGKHVVFLAGDEEYRSEEALPMLAKVLAFRHGFKCTVLFSIGAKGEIDPETRDNQPGLEALASADAVVMALRFRRWPDEQMRHFDAYLLRGMPILALRTSTHAFDFERGPYEKYGWRSKTWPGGFGKQVLGETWVSHWGDHGKQGTRAVANPAAAKNPLLNGVSDLFGTSDVYETHPPSDAEILMTGVVTVGLDLRDPPASGRKRTVTGEERGINDPPMPIVWTRTYRNEAGGSNWVMVCTMGAATDFSSEGLRRLIVNGVYRAVGRNVPEKASVEFVGEYAPSPFGFGGFKRGVRPSDLRLTPPQRSKS